MIRRLILKCPTERIKKALFSQKNLIRLLWTVTYVTSFVLFSNNLSGIYVKWLIDPDISVSVRTIPAHEVPFPAVTYCTPFLFSNRLVNATDYLIRQLKLFKFLPNYTERQQKLLSSLIMSCTSRAKYLSKNSFGNQTGLNVLKVLNETHHEENLLRSACGLEYGYIPCPKLLNVVPTKDGLCYSFNMQGYNTIFNKGVLSEDFDMFKRKTIAKSLNGIDEAVDDDNETVIWTPQDGYLTDDTHSVPYRSTLFSLTIGISYKHQDFYKCKGNGLRIGLHSPNEISMVRDIDAYMSQVTAVKVVPKSVKRNENMRKYPLAVRRCYFESEKMLKFFKSYTKVNCEAECLANNTLKDCGCVRHWMVRERGTPLCDPLDETCIYKVSKKVLFQRQRNSVSCNCYPPCHEVTYVVKDVKSQTFADDDGLQLILQKFGYSGTTRFDIISAASEIEEHEYYVAYSLQHFIADAGGLVSLFMGYSFITIAEMIQKFFEWRSKRSVGSATDERST